MEKTGWRFQFYIIDLIALIVIMCFMCWVNIDKTILIRAKIGDRVVYAAKDMDGAADESVIVAERYHIGWPDKFAELHRNVGQDLIVNRAIPRESSGKIRITSWGLMFTDLILQVISIIALLAVWIMLSRLVMRLKRRTT